MRRHVAAVVVALLFAGCEASEEKCHELAVRRSEARGNLQMHKDAARLGDQYADASLQYDRDAVRDAERAYDKACSK